MKQYELNLLVHYKFHFLLFLVYFLLFSDKILIKFKEEIVKFLSTFSFKNSITIFKTPFSPRYICENSHLFEIEDKRRSVKEINFLSFDKRNFFKYSNKPNLKIFFL